AEQQTEKLEKELENLNDPEYLEKIAREKLGLVRPNERVFVDANQSEVNSD
ncbi:MAG: septum formation initiator family protein, partial [Clostridia bacterium]|nr:septum formation initiator family protein [Clostridia bacterium]